MRPIVRPMSSSRPTPWALIAARSSGASAIRSTSCWASSLASRRRQTSSTSSLSIASSSARLTASLSSAPWTASSTTGPCRTRAIARSTASLSTAPTIASSAATSTARSIPVALRDACGRRARRRRAAAPRAAGGRSGRGRARVFRPRSGAVFHPAASIRPAQPAWLAQDARAGGRRTPPAAAGSSRRARSGRTTRPGRPRGTPARGRCAAATPSRRCCWSSPPGSNSPSAAQASTTLPAFWRTEPSSISSSGASARRRAELLAQLAQRAVARVLARLDLALRDRPGAVVALAQ